jgi:hypothetical protein
MEGSRTLMDIRRAVRHVMYNNEIGLISDRSYFILINAAKYSIPALRDDYTIQQLERIVQNELNEMNGGEEHAND